MAIKPKKNLCINGYRSINLLNCGERSKGGNIYNDTVLEA